MDLSGAMAQRIVDVFGLIYKNLIREKEDSIAVNTSSQTALLSVLLRAGPTKMSEIGKILCVTKPNITFLVDKMEEQGLISRKKDDKDRRINNICLTPKGRKRIEKSKDALHHKIMAKLEELTEQDLETLKANLDTAFEILRKLHADNDE